MSVAHPAWRLLIAHRALPAACAALLIVATLVLGDYGSWPDDVLQRRIGKAALDYLAGDGERAFDQLLIPHDRYYGAAFEAPLALVERLPFLDTPRSIHLGRHILTHLFFLAGGVACYVLVHRLFDNRLLALIAMLLFLLHPRLYAHSFLNSKDIPFLAAFMIALCLIHRAFRRDTLGAFLLCGVGVALLVNLRIMGIILVAAVLALRALDLAFANRAGERTRVLLTGGAFALAFALTYYASLPGLWTNPPARFAEMVRVLSSHPHQTYNLLRGEWLFSPDGPPFHYVPVWVGITTPPAILLLALAGAVWLAWRGLRRPRDLPRDGPLRFGILLAILPVATTVAVVVLQNNVYSDWRPLYFLYAPLLLLGAFGIRWLAAFPRGRGARAGVYALAGAAVAVAAVSMVRTHPHQESYFTVLTDRTTPERLTARYSMDYWNLSARDVFVGILDDHPSGRLFVSIDYPYAHPWSRLMLTPADRGRLTITRDFRSGRNNFHETRDVRACAASRAAAAYASRIHATTLTCVVDPIAYFGALRREALAGEPLARSFFAIHRDGRALTYVRDGCAIEDIAPRFFLHIDPVDAGDLPPWREPHGFDNLDQALRAGVARIDGNCVATALLPAYPIARLRTGQFTAQGASWEVEIAFDDHGRAVAPPDYAALRREARRGEPLARGAYDIYHAGRMLTYVRDGCPAADAEAGFFLHVVPVAAGDLPEGRREHGFENLDFTLAARGARIGGDCVAVARLPAYAVAVVRTGQYDEGGVLWEAEFALGEGE